MRTMTRRIILDTNVWMAFFIRDREGSATAGKLVDAALDAGYTLLYAVESIRDVFYLSNQAFKREIRAEKGILSDHDARVARAMAWGFVENMREIGTAVGSDDGDVLLATKLEKINGDFEDNLLIAAAHRANADFLVTWDRELLSQAFGATATPEAMLEAIRFQQEEELWARS